MSSAEFTQRRTPAQTIADVLARRPVLAPILTAFEPVLTAQAELAESFSDELSTDGAPLVYQQTDEAANGLRPLRTQGAAGGMAPRLEFEEAGQGATCTISDTFNLLCYLPTAPLLRRSAERLLPLLRNMPALSEHLPALEAFFLQKAESGKRDGRERLAEAFLAGNQSAVADIAAAHGLEPRILNFAAGFVLSPVLRALAARFADTDGQPPAGDIRKQAHCPVCGSLPSLAFLDRPVVDEKNAFLAGGGGKKHLHCDLCGTDWTFKRGACPACGEEGSGVIEILRESGVNHGERLDWCTTCKSYCPTLDLRECEFIPDFDATAIGMIPLYMVAAKKALTPLKMSFWNVF